MKRTKVYDAVVVGSGASGGWVAKELTEKGMDVVMLEAGPPRVPDRDFSEHVWPYGLRFRGFGDQKKLLARATRAASLLRLRRVQQSVLHKGRRSPILVSGRQTVHVDSWAPGRGKNILLGSHQLSL